MIGQNLGTDYPVFDMLDADQVSAAIGTVRLYGSINKAKDLGLSIDGSKIPFLDIERMYLIHSAMTEVQAARSRSK